jgi:hypothetical protein
MFIVSPSIGLILVEKEASGPLRIKPLWDHPTEVVKMKRTCPCHVSGVAVHVVPCCDGMLKSTFKCFTRTYCRTSQIFTLR